ncbi:MAG TPA: MarR family transcriptional regulator [Conexibacter sp.]|nr:MarR family transcriptional regulator [Conexibacter sp.]
MSEDAARAWAAMRALVLDDDRRREVTEAVGLSFARVRALRALAAEPLTLRALATALQTDAPYATRIVDDLEQLGLVERSVDPRDRRAKLVAATAAGAERARAAQRLLDRPPAALRALPPQELATLARILARLEH